MSFRNFKSWAIKIAGSTNYSRHTILDRKITNYSMHAILDKKYKLQQAYKFV
jgi:hypothetical protein